MQHVAFRQTLLRTGLLAFFCLALFSFKAPFGVDSYEIYLNNKLVLKQYAFKDISLQSLALDKASPNDQLVVYYTHCQGKKPGTGRSLTIKDDADHIVKEWKFEDDKKGMTIPVKALQQLEKNNLKSHLTLYYAASELPGGQLLAAL